MVLKLEDSKNPFFSPLRGKGFKLCSNNTLNKQM